MPLNISQTIKSLWRAAPKPLQVHEPSFTGQELAYVQDCIKSGWVSSAGSYVDQFEKALSEYTGLHAVLTVNGTAALHLCYLEAGIKHGDEVLCPSLSFVATANAISYCGAQPHFVDSEIESWGVDPVKLREYLQTPIFKKVENGILNTATGGVIKALVVMHVFGHPARLKDLKALCDEFNLVLIEDAAEALGSFYHGRHVGHFGRFSALSFNGNKTITTGGGGAVLTSDAATAARIKHLSTTARIADPYEHRHDEIGYNYRMPNINAALGLAQMETLLQQLEDKKKIAKRYEEVFADIRDVTFMTGASGHVKNNWLNTITVGARDDRNILIDDLAKVQIFCRGVWAPLHTLPMYKYCPRMDMTVCERLTSHSLNLPSSAFLARYL